jgi:hypothetical protein
MADHDRSGGKLLHHRLDHPLCIVTSTTDDNGQAGCLRALSTSAATG